MSAKPGVGASLNVFLVHRVSCEIEKSVYPRGNGNENVPAVSEYVPAGYSTGILRPERVEVVGPAFGMYYA